LRAHTQPRAVRTASAAQVRQPLHADAINRAQPYADQLRGVVDRLAEVERRS
jgi:hypothetical protein